MRNKNEKTHLIKNMCDLTRKNRTNIPEVIYARGKDDDSLFEAIEQLLKVEGKVLLTKCSQRQILKIKKIYKKKVVRIDNVSGTIILSYNKLNIDESISAAVIAAGSSDYFIAEETAITLEFFEFKVYRYYDCGIAGIHRLVSPIDEINKKKIDVTIVIAGMEGALPSIVTGLVKQPVIAVPTSVGYGTGLGGVTALLGMLNSCSPGICVVNIDNGFGAAACALKMVKWLKKSK